MNTENQAADIFTKSLRGRCLKNLRKDLHWYHQRKCDLSYPSPHYGVDNCETVFQHFGARFCPHMDVQNISHFEVQRRDSERPNLFNLSIRLQILILRRVLMRSNITNLKKEYCFLLQDWSFHAVSLFDFLHWTSLFWKTFISLPFLWSLCLFMD